VGQEASPIIGFICGVGKRTGTNFLYQLLSKHPRCAHIGEVEDYFLHYSGLLEDFSNSAFLTWNEDLEPQGNTQKAVVLRQIGLALEAFLVDQSERYASTDELPLVVTTKTPSAVGTDLLPRMFPTSRVIILMRDGRAVLESAKKTWGWGVDFDSEASAWARRVRRVLDLPSRGNASWWLMVRYEDLVADTESELRRIFGFLGLAEDAYDFAQIKTQQVVGSSQFRTVNTDANQVRLQKPADFNPLERFKHWSRWQHWRFAWLAGAELRRLDYEVPATANGPLYVAYNLVLDAVGLVRRPLKFGLLWLKNSLGLKRRGLRAMIAMPWRQPR